MVRETPDFFLINPVDSLRLPYLDSTMILFSLQLLVDFVFSHDDTPSNYALNSNFPRKTFHPDTDTHLSLSEIGINSSSILFVQDLTEESSDED